MSNDYGLSSEVRTIEHRGKKLEFTIRELSEAEGSEIFDTTNDKGKVDPERKKLVRARMLAKCVSDTKGPLEFEVVRNMPNSLANKLQLAVLEVNGYGADEEKAAGEG